MADFQRIRELGGALASSWRDATHLVMAAPLRTVKLLCCLSRCKYIVNIQWLLDCSAKNTFVDESAYTLGDAEFEKSFNCNIEKALSSPNRGSVLKVYTRIINWSSTKLEFRVMHHSFEIARKITKRRIKVAS